ncbi:hypothetical protein B0H67DRAFT_569593, partial [Lasiosphaeris hirsuta]
MPRTLSWWCLYPLRLTHTQSITTPTEKQQVCTILRGFVSNNPSTSKDHRKHPNGRIGWGGKHHFIGLPIRYL